MSTQSEKLAKLRERLKARVAIGGCKRCGNDRDDQTKSHCARCRDYFTSRAKSRRLAARLEKQGLAPSRAVKDHFDRALLLLEASQKRIEQLERDCAELFARIAQRERAQTFNKRIEKLEMKVASMDKRMAAIYKRAYYRGGLAVAQKFTADKINLPEPARVDFDELAKMSHVYQPR